MLQFIQCTEQNDLAVREELLAGLSATQAFTSPKYLYDALGSKLFEAICELPEYYPTRTEALIFNTHAGAIAQAIGGGSTLIDLGAGNCAKAARLFPVLQPVQYVPVDISVNFLRDSLQRLQQQFPSIVMTGLGMDFSHELLLPDSVRETRRVFFYPGSSIGNFTPDEALDFLQRIRAACDDDGGLLIGVDLVKDATELEAAYDDALGVTAAFNRNLISNVNRLVGTDLRLADWAHHALFNHTESRIEMHLVAQRDLTVQWPGGQRAFSQGERIHTENSYKWTVSGFSQLLREAGFAEPLVWTDAPTRDAGRFAVMWAGA